MADAKKEPTPAQKAKEFNSTVGEVVTLATEVLEGTDVDEVRNLPAKVRGTLNNELSALIAVAIRVQEAAGRR